MPSSYLSVSQKKVFCDSFRNHLVICCFQNQKCQCQYCNCLCVTCGTSYGDKNLNCLARNTTGLNQITHIWMKFGILKSTSTVKMNSEVGTSNLIA